MPAFSTLDDVVGGLSELEQRFLTRQDRRSIFLTLYGLVSAEMRDRLASGAFADPAWVHRYAVTFANLYREALDAYDQGRRGAVPRAWQLCFDAAAGATGSVLQDLLLGVNAHINNDLSLALERVSIDPERDRRRRDHDAVNAVLASVTERATARLSAVYAPGIATLDDCAGALDELLSGFSLEVARDSAWESAVALANARGPLEHALAARLISSRAALMARLLLVPSRNPAFVAACRRVEQGTGWLALLSAIRKADAQVS